MSRSGSPRTIGKVYLVGAGPGDPGLLTLKGRDCLAQADLILYDGLVNPLLLRHSQAAAMRTCRVDAPQGRRLNQSEINQQLVQAAQSGQTVVRLKGGDPFIFGRGSEEAAALQAAGIDYEVVPGITAATACAAYAGISLTHREHASGVAFVTGHEDPLKGQSTLPLGELVNFPGTLVFYMGLHRLPEIGQELMSRGKPPETPVAVISRGTTPRQQVVVGQLETIAQQVAKRGLHAPSLIIVGTCVSLRDTINWFEQRPLFGKSIGITTPEHQAQGPIDLALSLGAEPVLIPSLQILPIDDWNEVDATIAQLPGIDWLVFTSVNGVDAFLGRLWQLGADSRRLGHLKIAAIGDSTAARLAEYRLRADIVPQTFRAEALAAELLPHVPGKSVVWIRANRGRDILPVELTAAGARFQELVVYRHADLPDMPPLAKTLLRDNQLDWIGLSSPSVAHNVSQWLAQHAADCGASPVKLAAISPVTQAAAEAAGLTISATASTHTWRGIFEAIVVAEQ